MGYYIGGRKRLTLKLTCGLSSVNSRFDVVKEFCPGSHLVTFVGHSADNFCQICAACYNRNSG